MSNRRQRGKDRDASNEDAEIEAHQNQLFKMRKQHHMMERNRKQYYDETTILLSRQRKMLSELEEEQARLEENLMINTTPKIISKDHKAKNTISEIINRQDYYESMIEMEKNKIKDFDGSIKVLEKHLRDTRRKVPSTKILESEREGCKSANIALENRIQQSTVRLNAILADNQNLRHEIENLLKERDKFIIQARRLEKHLASTSKRKNEVMDQVTKAYTEREEAQSKMRSLRERIDRDSLKYSNEMKKIQRAIDYQTHLKSFVNTIASGEEEELFKRKSIVEQIEEAGLNLTLENYRCSISHLEESSDETSIDALLTNYLQADNDNYTLFSYISGLNNEATALSADIKKIQQEIDEVQGKGSQTERETCSVLGNIKEDIVKLQKEVTRLREEMGDREAILLEIEETSKTLFITLKCNNQAVQSVKDECKTSNVDISVLLSAIEQKVKELTDLRELMRDEGLPSADMIPLDSTELSDDNQSNSSRSSTTKTKPVIPHITHVMQDEDGIGPTTHKDFLISLRVHFSENDEE